MRNQHPAASFALAAGLLLLLQATTSAATASSSNTLKPSITRPSLRRLQQTPSTNPYSGIKPRTTINDPLSFAKAFIWRNTNVFVGPSLLVRLEQAWAEGVTKDQLVENFLKRGSRAVTFWSASDSPSKYLRIGPAPKSLGNSVPVNSSWWGDADYPGVDEFSNFAGLLQAIGYSSDSSLPKRMYMLAVTKAPAGVPVFVPTWHNVVAFFQAYIRVNTPLKDFTFAKGTLELLESWSFTTLTGCEPQCTWQDTWFGTKVPNNTVGAPSTWQGPTIVGRRINGDECAKEFQGSKGWEPILPADRVVVTEPTAIEAFDEFCDPQFITYRELMRKGCTSRGTNRTANIALARQMAELYKSTPNPLNKTLLFRAYLMTSCAGAFNSLFSGDGFTYTGSAGYLGATGQELLTGEMDFPEKLKGAKYVFFCPYDSEGNAIRGGKCPGECTACNGNEVKA